MKSVHVIKLIVFCLAGALVIIFHDAIMKNDGALVGIIVGSAVLLYGIDMTVNGILLRRLFGENFLFFGALSQFLIAAALFSVTGSIESVCIVWAVWSILREGKEMSESIHRLFQKKPGLLNIAESVVVIVFSFTMIIEPGEHHASFHVYLLGIELILEVAFMCVNILFDRYIDKKNQAKNAAIATTEAAFTDAEIEENTSGDKND